MANPPNNANTFLPPSPVVPMFLIITGITNSIKMIVTVSTPNSYVVGQLAYFSIPFDYGMFQLDGLTGQVVAVDVTNLILTFDINSNLFDAFVIPPAAGEKPASLCSAGSRNLYNNTTVPFHSLNGQVGN